MVRNKQLDEATKMCVSVSKSKTTIWCFGLYHKQKGKHELWHALAIGNLLFLTIKLDDSLGASLHLLVVLQMLDSRQVSIDQRLILPREFRLTSLKVFCGLFDFSTGQELPNKHEKLVLKWIDGLED